MIQKKMAKRLRRKILVVLLLAVVCVVLFGYFLLQIQTRISVSNQKENTQEKLDSMQEIIDLADESAAQNEASYDEVYQAKAASVAYIAVYDETFEATDEKMAELAGLMDVNNILLLDDEGNVLAQAEKSAADFTYARYNQLRTVFDTDEVSEAFEVTIDGATRRYYGAKIDDTTEAVVEQDPSELEALQEQTSSWKSMLGNVMVGMKGFSFAVSNQDYTFLYYPEEDMVGMDSLDAGLKVEDLSDGNFGWMEIGGEEYYCGVVNIPDKDAFVICAVPEQEITSSRNITVAIVLFIFFIVITAVVVYSIMTLREQYRQGKAEQVRVFGKIFYNKTVGRKILTFSGVGIIMLLVVSFYMQTLFSLSLRSMSNNRQVQEVADTLDQNEDEVELVTDQYNSRYLNKCQVAAYILEKNKQLWNKEDLSRLSDALGAEFLMIFNQKGKEVVSDSTYVNFAVSEEEGDQSYDFLAMTQGLEYYVQEAQEDEVSGTYRQYIAALLKDENGDADGFVQISMIPDKLEEALQTTTLSAVLDGVKPAAGGVVFAVDKETLTFVYYPEERLVDKDVFEYGMKETQLKDGLCDYVTIDSSRYFASSFETEDYYIYVATPQSRLNATRLPVAAASGIASFVCLLLVFMVLAFGRRIYLKASPGEESKSGGVMVDVVMPDGTIKKSEAASSRWSNVGVAWEERTAEHKIATLLKALMSILAIAICFALIFKDSFFTEDSIFLYVIQGKWQKGLNIFALTGCVMVICVGSTISAVLQQIIRFVSKAVNARGETVCHLLRSLVKYITMIAMLFYCCALIGVDTNTLIASAGILSLVVGLGAKELVSDILAGLFIIFESEFQVGDIVTIGDWRGTVQEIGVRTTKIMDTGGNVKIISNSAVSGVINMTTRNSYCDCNLELELTEDMTLENIESILAENLPVLKKKLPQILATPIYKGVYSFTGNTVTIRLSTECNEADKSRLGRDITREMKFILDRYGVKIKSATRS